MNTKKHWSRSAGIISRLKNTVVWFFVREKYCFGWKNKLNKTDYKPDEQGQCSYIYKNKEDTIFDKDEEKLSICSIHPSFFIEPPYLFSSDTIEKNK
jgi:hypothetical protein